MLDARDQIHQTLNISGLECHPQPMNGAFRSFELSPANVLMDRTFLKLLGESGVDGNTGLRFMNQVEGCQYGGLRRVRAIGAKIDG
ncbi:hypothetical protein D7V93_27160 [Corallococcus llansteffanensis]|uniref:Uncharacterized protein n=1 Tax=Corallococcus llansteffanensis TaxID=2316731 RepID=A0A3A8PHY4_9BACT|nr:hypothetical protein D7V93_27160 [Corallococcus llansteffanensis]